MLSRVCEIIETSDPSVLNIPPLEHDEVILKITDKHHSAGKTMRGAVAWCAGKFHAWNVRRKHKKILAEKSA
jgi:hypothetical protein